MRTTYTYHHTTPDYLETPGMFMLIAALTIAITMVAVYAYTLS